MRFEGDWPWSSTITSLAWRLSLKTVYRTLLVMTSWSRPWSCNICYFGQPFSVNKSLWYQYDTPCFSSRKKWNDICPLLRSVSHPYSYDLELPKLYWHGCQLTFRSAIAPETPWSKPSAFSSLRSSEAAKCFQVRPGADFLIILKSWFCVTYV